MEKTQKKSKLLTVGGIGLAVLLLIIVLLLTRCGGFVSSVSPEELSRFLADKTIQTIEINGDVVLEGPVEVNGSKTIIGNGRILLSTPLEGAWPESDAPTWGMGCATQNPADGTAMPALLQVNAGASLTLGGNITVDAQNNANAINVADEGALKVCGNATVQNGRYANVVLASKADGLVEGGSLLDGGAYNVLNYGSLRLTDGTVSGAKAGSAIYNSGSFTQEGGTVSQATFHNVYVAEGGSMVMTGGLNDGAAKDGIIVAVGGNAEVTGGDISNCIHGLCNNGEMTVGDVLLAECGIMNSATGKLDMKDTTVDTAEVYCLSNNGGTVNAENFTAIGCDTCAIYNFSGDMNLVNVTVEGSRDANISNAGGNLTIDGGTLDVCRDKSLVVGNGKAVVNNVKFLGTNREKYGVYAYGGETYLNDCSMENLSSTAVKLDAGAYVELNNVDIKDAAQNGFQNEGGRLVINDVTLDNMDSHGIYNNGGEVTANGLKMNDIKKNAIQHKAGTTTVSGLEASKMGNHGAYVEEGTLTVENSKLNDMAANGFYIVSGENKLVLKNVQISNAVQQGINNSSTVTATNLSISNTGKNGIYNKTGASMSVSGLTVSNVAEHGINNKASMAAYNVKITGTGAGSNGIQNNGTMTLEGASVAKSKNHGVYNSGVLNGANITVDTTKENGFYNDQGTATVKGLTVNGAGTQGINNNATVTLEDVKVTKAGSNGVYNSKGTATIKGLSVDGTGEHGVSNADTMTLSAAVISNTGASKNGIQNTGTLNVSSVKVSTSLNHGVYNKGTITGSGLTAVNVAGNGLYNDGGVVTDVDGISVTGAKDQGINNTGTLTAANVDVSGTGKNGVYNNAGTATITGLKVTNPGEHGVSNTPAEDGSGKQAVLTLTDAEIVGSGEGSNNIQNKGNLVIENVTLKNSSNHGIYNDNQITSKGSLTVSGSAVNGIYNYGGQMELAAVNVSTTGEHGVNNTGVLNVTTLSTSGVAANAIQNNGVMTVSGSAVLAGSGKHGLYNGNTFKGSSITVNGAGDLLASNAGDMVVHGMYLGGTAHKALYNNGYAELYNATIDGANVTNGGTAEYLVDNNGGILDLTDASLINANGTALHNRGNAYSAVTNVVIDGAGNYGIFVEGGSKLSGDGLVVNNITKNAAVSGAEGYGIKNQGTITMMDHVTLGAYDAAVTGSGANSGKGTSGIAQTALTNDAATATYSGHDLTIKNAANAAVYNKGIMYVTDMAMDSNRTGMYCRYDGWTTLAGQVTVTNTATNPFRLDGNESKGYNNGVTLVSGTNLTIDSCGSHAISNKGTFEAAADTTVTIKNVVGKQINAVNNNGGTMVLGNVNVDGVYVTIDMNGDKINTNSGNGIQTNGSLTLNGNAVIQNIFVKAASGKTDNSNSTGVVVKGSGSISGSGSVTVIGNQTAPAGYEGYTGLFNGVFVDAARIELAGDISVSNTNNQGIYIANAKAALKANNVSVTNAGTNGLYVNNKDGVMELAGNVTIDGAGQNGLFNVSNNAKIHGAVSISNVTGGHNGIRNDGSGVLTVDKDITISGISGKTTGTGRGNAIATNGKIYAKGNVTISGVTASGNTDNSSNNGIYGKGLLDVAGNVTITDKVAAGHGVFLDQGKLLADGNIEVNGTGSGKQGIYSANETVTDGVVTKTAEVEGANITVKDAGGNGIYVRHASNKLTATGTVTVINAGQHGVNNGGTVTAAAVSIDKVVNNGINNNGGTIQVAGAITVANPVAHGVSNNNVLNAASVTVTNVTGSGNGIQNSGNGVMTVTGAVTINKVAAGHGIYNVKTVSFGSFSASDIAKNGVNNGGSFTVTGNASVTNAAAVGIASNSSFTAGSVTIDTITAGPGLNNSGAMTVTGLSSVKNITGTDINAIQNNNTMTLGDVLVDGVYVTVGVDGEGEDKTNVGNGIHNNKTLTVNGTATITNVFTDKKGNNIGAGLNVIPGAVVNGNGGFAITGSTKDGSYGINNGIFIDAATVNMGGDISVSNVTNQGIYVANDNADLTAKNITVDNVTGNGIYVNKTTGALTTTGTVTVSNAGQHGINNAGTWTAGTVLVDTVGKNGINSTGTVSIAAGDVTVKNAGDTAVASNGVFNAPNSNIIVLTAKNIGVAIKADMNVKGISVTNVQGHGVVVNNKNVTMNVSGEIRVDGFTKRGISNTQAGGVIKAGNILITNGTSSNIDAGIKNGNASAEIHVTGNVIVSNIGGTTTAADVGNGITNTGIISVNGELKVENVTSGKSGKDSSNSGIWNKAGTITAGSLTVNGVDNRCGIYLNGGKIEAGTLTVQNVKNYVGVYVDSNATVKADVAIISDINHQGIQAQHANTIQIGTLFMRNIAKNGLRLYNNNGNPTVSVDTVVGIGVKEYVVAAAMALTSDNLTIGTVYYQESEKPVHDNTKSCVAAKVDMSTLTEEQLAELKAQLPESIVSILFPAPVVVETESTEGTESTEQTESTKQTESTEQTQSTKQTESTEQTQSTETKETTTPAAEETSSAAEGGDNAEQEAA